MIQTRPPSPHGSLPIYLLDGAYFLIFTAGLVLSVFTGEVKVEVEDWPEDCLRAHNTI